MAIDSHDEFIDHKRIYALQFNCTRDENSAHLTSRHGEQSESGADRMNERHTGRDAHIYTYTPPGVYRTLCAAVMERVCVCSVFRHNPQFNLYVLCIWPDEMPKIIFDSREPNRPRTLNVHQTFLRPGLMVHALADTESFRGKTSNSDINIEFAKFGIHGILFRSWIWSQ